MKYVILIQTFATLSREGLFSIAGSVLSTTMCFSAGASFGVSAVVAAAGVISTRRVKYSEQIMFACIPIIFALQQLTEGFVWITFNVSEYREWQGLLVAVFLFIAQVVWPIWVPLSILKIEAVSGHRKALQILVYCSFIVAPLQAYRLFFMPLSVDVTDYHVHYVLDFSIQNFGVLLNIAYFMTTIVPPFFSSRKAVIMLGALNLGSFIMTVILFERNVVSVWCFFAALISWQVIRAMKEEAPLPKLTINR